MGILQQGLNQVLTGATFLLQKTPGWQRLSEKERGKGLEEETGLNTENMGKPIRENQELLRRGPGVILIPKGRSNRASQELARIQRELSEQREQQDTFKEKLRAGSQHTTKAKQILRELQGGKE